MRTAKGLRRFERMVGCILAILFSTILAGCGGGSTGGSAVVIPSPAVSVSITSHPAGINAGLTYRFVATVLHATNTGVNWALACSCSGSDIGAIAPDGTYTAPAAVPQQLLLTVTATSVADASKASSAQFMLMPPIQIAMNRAPTQVVLGFSHQFSAHVENDLDNRGVEWFVGDVAGGNPTLGTIDSNGIYSAPRGSSEMIIAIIARSLTDPAKTDSTTVTLVANTHPNFTGDYIFSFSGPDGLGLTAAAGTVHLDGAGRLTATLDINSGSNNLFVPGIAVTGFYGFEHDNIGYGSLNYTVGQQTVTMSVRLALLNDQAARVLEFDGRGDGVGMLEKKAATGLTTALDGARVLALTGLQQTQQYNPQVTILGAFSGAGGSLSGIFDGPGDLDQTPLNGTYSFGSTNTLDLTFQNWNSGNAIHFRVYPVSSEKAFVMSTGMPILSGVVEKQTGGPYTVPSFTGTWIFSLQSVNSSAHLAGVRLVRMQSDGSGIDASGDMYDNNSYSVLDGPPYTVTFTQYHVAENGRGNANAQFAMPEPVVWYWVTPDRGYIKSSEGYGEFFRQQDAPFSLASLQVPLVFLLHGYNDFFFSPKQGSQLGVGTPNGTGDFVLLTSDVEVQDIADSIKIGVQRTGTYTIDNQGRGLITLDGGQFVVRFYAVSDTKLLLMRPGYDVIGAGTAEQYLGDMNVAQSH